MNYVAVIPARGGSKGVPNKNIRLIDGKPLIAWSIEQALECEEIDRVIVSTDSEEIAQIAKQYDGEVPFMRPGYLAEDTTATEPVLIHAVEWLEQNENYSTDAVVLLQPTSPVRKTGRLSQGIQQFESEKADSLLSVCENHHFFWVNKEEPEALYNYKNRPRRQDIQPEDRWCRENGSIYITNKEVLLNNKNRLGGNISMFLMDEEESWEIDSLTDFKIVEIFLKELER
ncbi:cytidylyltransferase domain-containing protein [Pseudalkalibacillus caeni]|uniref:Acylneuraminate cytidylyltransferase family protein n=1 Tax=Exobacillus caeni TaxID=2574798 RepID=A0A5R9EY92_9BACL|nr:acylneuraminate cytidylyltransferase family protein [Pseudalkalibacillus caeni]TLS35166.1 acylneuraminate cytidylyltransferase family protein [Pseudalkalibacillus caeni]